MREFFGQDGRVILAAEPRDYQKWDRVARGRACEWRGPKPVPSSHRAADSYLLRVQEKLPRARYYEGGKLKANERFVCPSCLCGTMVDSTSPHQSPLGSYKTCTGCEWNMTDDGLRRYHNSCVTEVG